MLFNLFAIVVAIAAFLGAGVLSQVYLEERFGPRASLWVPAVVVAEPTKKDLSPKPVVSPVSKPSTTTQKKPVAKTPIAVVAPQKSVSTPLPTTGTTVLPGPLKTTAPIQNPTLSTQLTIQGVVDETNRARMENGGFLALRRNETLDRIARMKLDDMFAKQYFEHISPAGIGPSDLAKTAGYVYILIGENLALGNFKDNKDIVTAWMNSPGHRANILNPRYEEIGVAVLEGMYEGRKTWIGVQSFGKPRSSCPAINEDIKAAIEINSARILELRAELDAKKAQLNNTPSSDPNYNTYVEAFNVLVPPYNALVETNRALVAQYNEMVRAFNVCAEPPSVT